ncbi:hypothetical protein B0I33_11060 [Prauserella shujinwangii]|uniref:Uncharacterized protein n=1 Tax=Prauserella shujinwangii TaxID=1453103 RepID=A0A2T0LNY2_9PSEU|nr:hypothetical protein [Prauserella shujinwangii]PRX44961.1 hypothetical protein B0I33_11060 [Prauserella shujinwangii]
MTDAEGNKYSRLPEPIGRDEWTAEQAVNAVPGSVLGAPDPADRIWGSAASPLDAAKGVAEHIKGSGERAERRRARE